MAMTCKRACGWLTLGAAVGLLAVGVLALDWVSLALAAGCMNAGRWLVENAEAEPTA